MLLEAEAGLFTCSSVLLMVLAVPFLALSLRRLFVLLERGAVRTMLLLLLLLLLLLEPKSND